MKLTLNCLKPILLVYQSLFFSLLLSIYSQLLSLHHNFSFSDHCPRKILFVRFALAFPCLLNVLLYSPGIFKWKVFNFKLTISLLVLRIRIFFVRILHATHVCFRLSLPIFLPRPLAPSPPFFYFLLFSHSFLPILLFSFSLKFLWQNTFEKLSKWVWQVCFSALYKKTKLRKRKKKRNFSLFNVSRIFRNDSSSFLSLPLVYLFFIPYFFTPNKTACWHLN